MAKTIRLGRANIIELELAPINKKGADVSLLWAKGRLLIAGDPAIASEDGDVVEWTWLDVLEWVAKHWSALLLEQAYPFNVSTLGMGTLMRDLNRRWEDMPEDRVEDEEEQALQFLARHDLASAFKGIYFPSVYLLRLGNTLQATVAETDTQYSLNLADAVDALEAIANGIVELIEQHCQPQGRAQMAIDMWQKRHQKFVQKHLILSTGLTERSLKELNASNSEFWEFDAAQPLADTELMAAARMTSGKLNLEQQTIVLSLIRQVPLQATPILDQLSVELKHVFKEEGQLYDQGYWVANWLRGKLNKPLSEPVQPAEVLKQWNVKLQNFELDNSGLDALACWGHKHGPAILINQVEESSAAHKFGENSTLAHEICHLLLDRGDTLPVAEVLNGNSPERLEKRARAFAAELLLPREAAAQLIQKAQSLEESITQLSNTYRVSEKLVTLQIKNSSIYHQLSQEEQQVLAHKGRV